MTVCPFCRNASPDPNKPCPSCGRRGADHPSVSQMQGRTIGSGWGDDEEVGGGDLDLSKGAAMGHGGGASAYAGGGLSLGDDDDPFAEDAPQGGALELDLPSQHPGSQRAAPVAPPSPGANANAGAAHPGAAADGGAAARSQAQVASPGAGASPPRPDDPAAPPASAPPVPVAAPPPPAPPDPAALIARFPPPPQKISDAPLYAMRVLWRQMELRQDLASLRRKRSPDVPLYERALKTHDPKTFALGLALTCAGVAVASFIFFLPVILRFLRDPD